jgi:hypothetical protein
MTNETSLPLLALQNLLIELTEGPSEKGAWVLGRGDAGLVGLLRTVPAETASKPPAEGRMTIAAHAHHVKYGLELLNRWAGGEENPFATADWEGSWAKQTVSRDEWQGLVAGLQREAASWIAALEEPREWDEFSFTGALASAAHIAYHLGAIRQLALLLT